jgi:hypothetical protein
MVILKTKFSKSCFVLFFFQFERNIPPLNQQSSEELAKCTVNLCNNYFPIGGRLFITLPGTKGFRNAKMEVTERFKRFLEPSSSNCHNERIITGEEYYFDMSSSRFYMNEGNYDTLMNPYCHFNRTTETTPFNELLNNIIK